MTTLTPCLWFDTEAQDAANFYLTVFPNSRITDITYYGEAGPRPAEMVLTVEFELDGHPFTALNGGPEFSFSEAVSFQIDCADQAELDRYWEALTADDGQDSPYLSLSHPHMLSCPPSAVRASQYRSTSA